MTKKPIEEKKSDRTILYIILFALFICLLIWTGSYFYFEYPGPTWIKVAALVTTAGPFATLIIIGIIRAA